MIFCTQTLQRIQILGLLEENMILLPIRNSYLSLVSASLLLSEINIVVLPPSRMMGYLPINEPVNSFESGIFNRCRSCIILYSNVSFFILCLFYYGFKIFGIRAR